MGERSNRQTPMILHSGTHIIPKMNITPAIENPENVIVTVTVLVGADRGLPVRHLNLALPSRTGHGPASCKI